MQARIKEKHEVAKGTLMVVFDLLGHEADFMPGQYFWVELIDPPYEIVESLHMTLSIHLPRLLADDGLVVYETRDKQHPELALAERTSRKYGSVRLTLFEHA